MIREDLPEPDNPVTTTNLFLGMATETFRRLLLRAPTISICLAFKEKGESDGGGDLGLTAIDSGFGAVFAGKSNTTQMEQLPGSKTIRVVVKFLLKGSGCKKNLVQRTEFP